MTEPDGHLENEKDCVPGLEEGEEGISNKIHISSGPPPIKLNIQPNIPKHLQYAQYQERQSNKYKVYYVSEK